MPSRRLLPGPASPDDQQHNHGRPHHDPGHMPPVLPAQRPTVRRPWRYDVHVPGGAPPGSAAGQPSRSAASSENDLLLHEV